MNSRVGQVLRVVAIAGAVVLLTVGVVKHRGGVGTQGVGAAPLTPGLPGSIPAYEYPAASFKGALPAARNYPYAGIRLSPPAPGVIPAVTGAIAYAACKTSAPCLLTGSPTVELAIFSDDQFGFAEPGAPATTHPFQNMLAWAITWHNTACEEHGPPGRPDLPANIANSCDKLVLVDAGTGKFLTGITGPGPS